METLDRINELTTNIEGLKKQIQILQDENAEAIKASLELATAKSELNHANLQIKAIAESTGISFWSWKANFTQEKKGIHWGVIFGIDSTSVTSRNMPGYFPEDVAHAEKSFKDLLANKTDKIDVVLRYQSKKMGIFWLRSIGVVTERDSENQPGLILGITQDITEIKKMEKELRENEAKLKVIFNNTSIGIALKNSKGVILDANPAYCQMIGYSSDEILGKNHSLFTAQAFIQTEQKYIRDTIKGKRESISYNKKYIHKSGSIFWARINISAVREDKNVKYLIVIAENIDVQKRAEEAIQESEQRLSAAFESSPVVMFLVDKDRQILKINRTALDYFKIKGPDFKIRRFGDAFKCLNALRNSKGCGYSENCEYCPVRNALITTLTTGKPIYKKEVEMLVQEGEVPEKVNLLLSTALIKSNESKQVLICLDDITFLRQTEHRILNTIIETEERERNKFAQDLHDGLGPIISTIKLYLQWLVRPDSKADKSELVKKAEEALNAASLTIKEISNNLSPHILKNFGINAAILSFIDRIKDANSLEIEFSSTLEGRFPENKEVIIYRTITECINNTIKHAFAKKITVLIKPEDNKIKVDIKDDGVGFDFQEAIDRKTGLGLFNLQNRLKSAGGNIVFHSSSGKGTEVLIELPV